MTSIRTCLTLGICVLVLVFSGRAHAADRYSAEVIGRQQGINASSVLAIRQDHRGLLWVGTRRGLYLYDGRTAILFQHDPFDIRSISDNFIRTIFEDSHGVLWVGTDAGGLSAFDRVTGSFRHFRHEDHNPASINNNNVYSLAEDPTGGLLVGTQEGLARIDLKTFAVQRIQGDGVPEMLTKAQVLAMCFDRSGVLWVGTKSFGLFRRDPRTGNFTNFRHDGHDSTSILNDDITAIANAPGGDLWIGTDAGLDRVTDLAGARIRSLRPTVLSAILPPAVVTSFAEGKDHSLAIGTLAGAVLIPADGGPAQALPIKNAVQEAEAIEVDHAGAVWVGTRSGLSRISRVEAFPASLEQWVPAPGHQFVTSILQDGRNRLWIGSSAGLLRRESAGSNVRTFPELWAGRWILSLAETRDGTVWASSFSRLVRFDPKSDSYTVYKGTGLADELPDTYLLRLLADRRGQLWIGSYDRGLYRWKPGGHGFERFTHLPGDPSSISDDGIGSLYEAGDGSIWVGGRKGSLDRCDAVTVHCQKVLPRTLQGEAIPSANVTQVREDGSNRLWVATAGAGVIVLDRSGSRVLARYGRNNGLPDWNVVSLLPDQSGIWMGTLGGLARLDFNSSSIRTFSTSNGLPDGDLLTGAVLRLSDKIAFGTTTGLWLFDAKAHLEVPAPSPVVLTSVVLRRPGAEPDPARWAEEPVTMDYGTAISVDYAIVDFKPAAEHQYSYLLDGRNGHWTDLGARGAVTFADLAPGRYVLLMRGRNGSGVWSDAPALRIRVIPPWWMTWWFRLIAAGFGALLFLGVPSLHIVRLRKRYQRVVTMKRDREKALADAHAAQEALHVAYERLQVLARKLEVASETERRRIAHELHDEMGQLLTVAKINLQLIPDEDGTSKRVRDTIQLIDEMIVRVRELSLDLKPPLLYELGLAPALRAFLEAQQERSGLLFDVDLDACPAPLPVEIAAAAFRIVQEATTNAIRHAQASRVTVSLATGGGMLHLQVQDDGCGFDVEGPFGARHLGLTGIRERGQILGGEVVISSSPGKGTKIAVRLPILVGSPADTDLNSAML